MIRTFILAAFIAVCLSPAAVLAADKKAVAQKPAANAFFVNIKNGQQVKSPVKIKFGVKGVKITPAGTVKAGTGHFHLFIDTILTPDQLGKAIPSDATHLHFGKGQKDATVTLTPGRHTLQLVIGDGKHVPLTPPVASDVIMVIAK